MNTSLLAIKSALISAAIAAVLAISGYIVGVGDVFKLDPHALINAGVLSALTAIVSLIKAGLTLPDGTALGVQIKSPTPPPVIPTGASYTVNTPTSPPAA